MLVRTIQRAHAVVAVGGRLSALVRKPWQVPSVGTIAGTVSENGVPAQTRSSIRLHAADGTCLDTLLVIGASYRFMNVSPSPGGYLVVGVDPDGVFDPVISGPVFPV